MHCPLVVSIASIAKGREAFYIAMVQIVARILAGLLLAFAAVPAQACAAPPHGAQRAPAAHGDHSQHKRDALPCERSGHRCVGCATPVPDTPRLASGPIAWDAPAPRTFVARSDAQWRPGFDPPPPRPAI